MPTLRLATFDTNGLAQGPADDERLVLQALAVRDTRADVMVLQAVADMATLDAFRDTMGEAVGRRYDQALMLQGNDTPTGSPAVLSDLPLVHARSHRALTFAEIGRMPPEHVEPETPVLSRDCLEVEIEQEGRRLSLFVCHFSDPPQGPLALPDEERARQRRLAEAQAVRWIIERRFSNPHRAEWVVLGSLGDQATDQQGRPVANHGLGPLVTRGFAIDLAEHSTDAPSDGWTRFIPPTERYARHDQLLLSPALAARNRDSRMRIVRAGLPYRAERHAGQRYPRIGWQAPAASWSCPVAADITFTGKPASIAAGR